MPRLPDLGTERLQTPQPALGVVSVDNSEYARAIAGAGNTLSEVGQLVYKEQARRDLSAAEDAFTKARAEQLDLAAGEDGYLNKKGEAALTDTFHKDYIERFDKRLTGISDNLQNDKQRDLFKKRAEISRIQVSEGLLSHSMQQDEVVNKERYVALLNVEQKTAQMNALNPVEIGLSVMRVKEAVKSQAERNNWPAEFAKTEETNQTSMIHEAVIDTMIQQGYDLNAQTYYKTVKDSLSADATEKLGAKIKSATTDGKAFRAVNDLLMKDGPKTPNDPFKLSDMDKQLKEQFSDDIKAYESAHNQLRLAYEAHNAQQTEMRSFNIDSILGVFEKARSSNGFNSRNTIANIQKSEAYLALGGKDQNALVDHMMASAHKEDVTDPNLFGSLFKKIHLPPGSKGAITSPDQLYDYIGKGLSVESLVKLRAEIDGKNQPEGELLKQFKTMAQAQISGTTLFGKDPKGDDNFYKWNAYFDQVFAQKRKEGKSAYELLDPGTPDHPNKDYLGPTINGYTRDFTQQTEDYAARFSTNETQKETQKYTVGQVYPFKQGNLKYKGGDPNKAESWEKVK